MIATTSQQPHRRDPSLGVSMGLIAISLFLLPGDTPVWADTPPTTGTGPSVRTPPPAADSALINRGSFVRVGHPLVLRPTLIQQLAELRINTGKKAVLRDGTMNAVYARKTPGKGHTFLNFHMEVTSQGLLTLRPADLRLELTGRGTTGYTPFDWFLDVGLEEVRGDSLIVPGAGIVQFTTEVPTAEVESLTLVVAGQSVGTVATIREEIRARARVRE